MESLYLLIPVSIVLVLAIGGLLAWSVLGGQFDELEDEGRRILDDDETDASLAKGHPQLPDRSSVTGAQSQREP